jgi:hypothetical protein
LMMFGGAVITVGVAVLSQNKFQPPGDANVGSPGPSSPAGPASAPAADAGDFTGFLK